MSPTCWSDDPPVAVDHEAFGHARRAERELHRAAPVVADRGHRDRRCARGNRRIAGGVSRIAIAVDRDARLLQPQQLRRLGDARDAPAGEDVEQARLARRRSRRSPGPACPARAAAARSRAAACRPSPSAPCGRRACSSPQPTTANSAGEQRPAAARAASASCRTPRSAVARARRRSRRTRPSSDSAPPIATSAPPDQISVTNGFHHSRSCQRPCSSGWPSTV